MSVRNTRPRRRLLVAVLIPLLILATSFSTEPVDSMPSTVDAAVTAALSDDGRADVYVLLRDRADLPAAVPGRAADPMARGARVAAGWRSLTGVAERSQAGIRAALGRRGVRFEPFWIVNAVLVPGASPTLVRELAARADVRRVRLAGHRRVPTPIAATALAGEPDWNLDRIRAPRAWADFNALGQGVVVASIDTGAQFDHPALVRKYRGYRGGTFDHNYNWFDPSAICPQPAPCDNNGHGTHVTGTMVGDDGADHIIGVAPLATWISAKGCESNSCSDLALLRAGQWVIAPTDLSGTNPRPDLAPHVVNNSWGGFGGDDFYQEIVNAWTGVGIFPVFSAGNDGPGCGSAGSPGDYINSYAVGAFDDANAIAAFSSRGASLFDGEIKPNLAAPGVAVRSSVPTGSYDTFSGTSMAAPHVSGVVALMWSVAPVLVGDVGLTRRLLDQSAVDTGDTSCGGTFADNNVWGEGRLDAYAAVERSPRGPTGVVSGVVTDTGTGQRLADVTMTASAGGRVRYTTPTAADGTYRMLLSVGTYQVTATRFGYATAERTVQVTAGSTTVANLPLERAARHTVTGVVRDAGGVPVPGVSVSFGDTPLPPDTTDAAGAFTITDVPAGRYTLTVSARGCSNGSRQDVMVDGDESFAVAVPPRPDAAGYTCFGSTSAWTPGTTLLPLTGDQNLSTIPLPFPFTFYGREYTSATVTTNGFLTFDRAVFTSTNRSIPAPAFPNAGIYAFWDDLVVDASAGVYTAVLGTAPERRFVVEWRNVTFYQAAGRVTFALTLHENGQVVIAYSALSAEPNARGGGATVGIENAPGTAALQYAFNEPVLVPNTALAFRPPARVRGSVTTTGENTPIVGAVVQARRDDQFVAQTATDNAGAYDLPLPVGSYTITASKAGFTSASTNVTLAFDGEIAVRNLTLAGSGHAVTGVVRDPDGAPVPGIRVRLTGPVELTGHTDDSGSYRIANVPAGTYTVHAGNPCVYATSGSLVVDGGETAHFQVTSRVDPFGYRCQHVNAPYLDGTDVLPLTGDDEVVATQLPFPFRLYGQAHTRMSVSTNGFISFTDAVAAPHNGFTPDPAAPNAAIYALWDDLLIDGAASVRTATTGQAPQRRFVVEWRNAFVHSTGLRVTMALVLAEDGTVDVRVRDTDGFLQADTGLEDATGTTAFRYDDWSQPIVDGLTIRFVPPGVVEGVVRDVDDGTAVSGAVVRGLRNGSTVSEVRSDASGNYRLPLPAGSYTIEVQKGSGKVASAVTIPAAGAVVTRDVSMPLNVVTGRVTDAGGTPLPGVTVKFMNWPDFVSAETTTGADGTYVLPAVSDGVHAISVNRYGDGCLRSGSFEVNVTTNQTVNAALQWRADAYGHTCAVEPLSWVDGATVLPLTGANAVTTVPLPFAFRFYGTSYTSAHVSTNGLISFTDAVPGANPRLLPDATAPNAAIYALWTGMEVDAAASVRTATLGSGPDRRFVIEWRNVLVTGTTTRARFSITLHQNGEIVLSYQSVGGYSPNVAIEDATGDRYFQYVDQFAASAPAPGLAVRFTPPA
jgi:subtilisin family serine protease